MEQRRSRKGDDGGPYEADQQIQQTIFHSKFGRELDHEKVVRNFICRNLTPEEKQVLTLGLNFAVTPKNILTEEIIATTEATARQVRTWTLRWPRN